MTYLCNIENIILFSILCAIAILLISFTFIQARRCRKRRLHREIPKSENNDEDKVDKTAKEVKPLTETIIIGEYNDGVLLLFDHYSKSALVVYNQDPSGEKRNLWAHTKVLDRVDDYDKDHLFFINMANEKVYKIYINDIYAEIDSNDTYVLKGYPMEHTNVMNIMFYINNKNIHAVFNGSFLYKN